MRQAFFIALQFLTRVPVPVTPFDPKSQGLSILFYPVIGLLLGLSTLIIAFSITGILSDSIVAIVLVSFGIAMTGALHLDGLADSADAWLGSHGDKQRCLDIMHDSACGPAGVIVLVIIVLAKFSAYEVILAEENWYAILVAPILARAAVIGLFLTTPYARPGGLGDVIKKHLPQTESYWAISISIMVVVLFLNGFWPCVITAIIFYLLRGMMMKMLQGTTGDTTGAMIEIIEVSVLIVALISV